MCVCMCCGGGRGGGKGAGRGAKRWVMGDQGGGGTGARKMTTPPDVAVKPTTPGTHQCATPAGPLSQAPAWRDYALHRRPEDRGCMCAT